MALVHAGAGLDESVSEARLRGAAFSRIEDPLVAAASACGDKIALIDGDDAFRYEALAAAAADFAVGLQAAGLGPGDRVLPTAAAASW